MGVTQYIGARYVPTFADPAEWTNTRTYEPLTIVMHEGNSFTSKQFVPVGIDINNDAFWAETGNYNAQVEAYRQEVINLAKALPSTTFNEANTVENALNAIREEISETIRTDIENLNKEIDVYGITQKIIVEDNYIVEELTFPKEHFKIGVELNSGNPDVTKPVQNYALEKQPFFCMNCTNNQNFVYNGIVRSSTTASEHGGRYPVLNDGSGFLCYKDTQISFTEIVTMGYNYAFAGWQPLVSNYDRVYIDPEYKTFNSRNPFPILCEDENNFYVTFFIGRLIGKPGALASEIQDYAMQKHVKNCALLDGGGSMRAFFGRPFSALLPKFGITYEQRQAYTNITFSLKEETK